MQKQLNPCFHVDDDPMEFMGDFWEFECIFFCQAMKDGVILHQHGLSYNFVKSWKLGQCLEYHMIFAFSCDIIK